MKQNSKQKSSLIGSTHPFDFLLAAAESASNCNQNELLASSQGLKEENTCHSSLNVSADTLDGADLSCKKGSKDQSTGVDDSLNMSSKKRKQTPTFPEVLMTMLSDEGSRDTIAWSADGKSFAILRQDKFVNENLPRFFRGCQFSSFHRKLNRWGFRVINIITAGRQDSAYYNEFFQRNKSSLLKFMSCKKLGSQENSQVYKRNLVPLHHSSKTELSSRKLNQSVAAGIPLKLNQDKQKYSRCETEECGLRRMSKRKVFNDSEICSSVTCKSRKLQRTDLSSVKKKDSISYHKHPNTPFHRQTGNIPQIENSRKTHTYNIQASLQASKVTPDQSQDVDSVSTRLESLSEHCPYPDHSLRAEFGTKYLSPKRFISLKIHDPIPSLHLTSQWDRTCIDQLSLRQVPHHDFSLKYKIEQRFGLPYYVEKQHLHPLYLPILPEHVCAKISVYNHDIDVPPGRGTYHI